MNTSVITHERISQNMTSKASPQNEPISTWLKVEMKVAGSEDLPIHIDTDIEDDNDPFGPQGKHILLTDERKRMIANKLNERRQIHKIRKIRREERRHSRRMGEKEKRARQEWNRFLATLPTELILEEVRHTDLYDLQIFLLGGKTIHNAFNAAGRKWKHSLARLPVELILEVIRHTRLGDLQNFLVSGRAVYNVFRDNKAAVPPGIVAVQYSELKWLFGSGRRRSSEQKQALKDYIGTHQFLNDPRKISEMFDKIEKGEFVDRAAISCLRDVEYGLTEDVTYHKGIGIELARQSALCLRMFSSWEQRIEETKSDQSLGDVTLVRAMPLETCLWLYERQTPVIQANIRDVLETKIIFVMRVLDALPLEPGELGDHSLMGQETRDWITRYYSPKNVGRKIKMDSMGQWISKLAAGYILDVLLPAQPWLGPDLLDIAENIRFENGFFMDVLAKEFTVSGSTDELWKKSRDFTELIGLNLGRLLEGTEVGEYLDRIT